jgi:hypothetical protein
VMSALLPEADIDPSASDVRFVPGADVQHHQNCYANLQ